MRLVAAGVDHRTAPLRVRERAAASVADEVQLLRYLVGHASVRGAALLSTCNRIEFYLSCPDDLVEEAAPRLARYLDPGDAEGLAGHMVSRVDADAAGHLMRVAAGLESMVVGEAQVLGQLKDSHRAALDAGTLDARLDFVLRRSISVGKRVRTETGLAQRAGTLSDAALQYAAGALGGLRGRGALLVGAGTMNRLAARRLGQVGAHVFYTSRSASAQSLAASHGGAAVALDSLVEVAPQIDFVLTSTSSRRPVLEVETVALMQAAREHRPLCIVDIAVPRDVDPRVATIDGVTLVDIDSLGAQLEQPSAVEGDVERAESLIAAELPRTMRSLEERDTVTPTIAALQRKAERIRSAEVERTLRRTTGLDESDRRRVDAMTQSLVRKLLHTPITRLRETGGDPQLALTIREVFDLDA